MAKGRGLKVVNGGDGSATAQKHCSGYATALARYARQDLRYASAVLLRGVCAVS